MIEYHAAAMAGRKSTGGKGGRPKGGRKKEPEVLEPEVLDAREGAADGDADADGEPEAEPALEELADADAPVDIPFVGPEPDLEVAEPVALDEPEPARPGAPATRGIARRDPLTAYVQEIRRIPLLTREEEHDLAARFRETGDPELARRLVTANLRLVVKIAHEYRRAYRNLLDLVQEGNIGLMQAVKKYDPYRGVKLSSYAAWWIRAYILKFILNNWRLVKLGTTQAQRKLFFNLRKEKDKLEKLGFEPEHKLLAERMNVSEEEVADMEQRLDSADMSLDAPLSRDDEGGRTRLDAMPSSDIRPDAAAEAGEFRQLLREKLETFASRLTGREETLFRERWLTDTPHTLQQIGDEFNISRERARQIEKRLLDRLRTYLEEELGTAVDIGAQNRD